MSNGKRILLVDDDATVRSVFETALKNDGFDLTICENGMEALKNVKTSKETFDLFIVDLTMPILDGFKLISAIKELKKYKNTPIVVLSGNRTEMAVEKAISLGINDFLLKNSPRNEILGRVKSLIGE